MLTRKQYELLMYIHNHLKATGVSPSFDEMKDALDLKSKSGIHRLITGLEERGFIRRLAHRARALEVVRLPDNSTETRTPPPRAVAEPRFSPSIVRFSPNLTGRPAASDAQAVQLPLYGRIAAGNPIEAMRDTTMIDIPASLLGPGEHFALSVDGDSMIDAGIFDGDTAIIRHTETAENGSIVVALIDDSEVTLKRLRRKGASVALEPANTRFETRIFPPDRVRVQGCLIGLLRKY